jgi:hypothetical protein
MLYVLLASNNNLTDQGDETEGLEMKVLGGEGKYMRGKM